jgi:hypothetical protein
MIDQHGDYAPSDLCTALHWTETTNNLSAEHEPLYKGQIICTAVRYVTNTPTAVSRLFKVNKICT